VASALLDQLRVLYLRGGAGLVEPGDPKITEGDRDVGVPLM
jgi:hypothetical protein